MLDIFYAIGALAFVACMGIFLALMIEYGYSIKETFICIVEAIQDIKAYKADRNSRGS